jgi:hypothetical protein
MTSSGPNSQSYNFTHMFQFNDINGNLPKLHYTKGSIMYLIDTHPEFTKFCYLIKLAEMDIILDNIQSNFTLFVPADSELKYKIDPEVFLNMDKGTARTILKSSILDGRIPSELLTDSPSAYFNTNCPPNRLFITNINGNTRINNSFNVIHFDILANNGIVHVVDNLINPLQL